MESGWKAAAEGNCRQATKKVFQTVPERPWLLQFPRIRIRVERMRKTNHAAASE